MYKHTIISNQIVINFTTKCAHELIFGWKIQKVSQYGGMCNLILCTIVIKIVIKFKTMTSCKNDKTKLQMIGSSIESHVIANLMITYIYKISFSV
jgi:hypothetical protein